MPVPAMAGDTTAQASQQLTAAGFALGTVSHGRDAACTNISRVIAQAPGAGVSTPVGTAVAITLGQQDPGHPCP